MKKNFKEMVENPRMVIQQKQPIQHAIIELQKTYQEEGDNPMSKPAVQKRLQDAFYENRDDGYGVREGYQAVSRYMSENVDKRKLEKFYLAPDYFDERFNDLDDPYQNYQGEYQMLSAHNFVN